MSDITCKKEIYLKKMMAHKIAKDLTHHHKHYTLGEEIKLQIGIFLSVVTGFVVAQAWNRASIQYSLKHKYYHDEEWFPWVYAIIATIIGLTIMICWGYAISVFSSMNK